METITLKINNKTKKGQALLEFLRQYVLNDKNVEVVKILNEETLQAIDDVEQDRTFKVKDSQELFKELGI